MICFVQYNIAYMSYRRHTPCHVYYIHLFRQYTEQSNFTEHNKNITSSVVPLFCSTGFEL
jgi:hypothetical protein